MNTKVLARCDTCIAALLRVSELYSAIFRYVWVAMVECIHCAGGGKPKAARVPVLIILGLLCFAAGFGAGIGSGYGIWSTSGDEAALSTARITSYDTPCEEGEHNEPLITYILHAPNATVRPLTEGYYNQSGKFSEIYVSKEGLPDTIPYLTNAVGNGQLHQDVLNATKFLQGWVYLSLDDNDPYGIFGSLMKAGEGARRCYKQEAEEAVSVNETTGYLSDVSPNAMIRFENDDGRAWVVDIFDLRDDGEYYVMTVRSAPNGSEFEMTEGSCHAKMQMDMPHYHHSSTCAEIILDAYIAGGPGVQGEGMTAFIKLGTTSGTVNEKASDMQLSCIHAYKNNLPDNPCEKMAEDKRRKKEEKEKFDNKVNEAPSILQDTFMSLGK